MTERERLAELIESAMYWGADTPEKIAERLIDEGVICPPCKVRSVVWCLIEEKMEEEGWFISEEHVTDVSARGIWLSQFYPPESDHGSFIPWEWIGAETFATREEAEAALAERRKA